MLDSSNSYKLYFLQPVFQMLLAMNLIQDISEMHMHLLGLMIVGTLIKAKGQGHIIKPTLSTATGSMVWN